jgi:hypothetical protein
MKIRTKRNGKIGINAKNYLTVGPGDYPCGDNLYLIVAPSGGRRWLFRYQRKAIKDSMGLKKVFRSSTQFSAAAYRTQLFNPEDMPNVVKVQSGYKVQPLSAFLNQPAPPAAPAINFPKIDKELVKTGFFDYLDFSLQFAPPRPEENDIRAKLASASVPARLRFQVSVSRAESRDC